MKIKLIILVNILLILVTTLSEAYKLDKMRRKPGEISKQKCKEYSKYRIVKMKAPTLLLDYDEEDVENDECGIQIVELIIGGTQAKEKEFPHMAVLGYKHNNGIKWECGGSIISEKFILTAAHCIEHRQLGLVTYAKVGTIDLSSKRDGELLEVGEHFIHPNYNRKEFINDIALIKLKKAAKMTPFARPACLYLRDKFSVNSSIACGFGETNSMKQSREKLFKVILNLFETKECKKYFPSDLARGEIGFVEDTQLCAGGLDYDSLKDTCAGDSGGPLQIYHLGEMDVKCMYDIIGVTSYGKKCNGFGVYTKISKFIEWIENIVWPIST